MMKAAALFAAVCLCLVVSAGIGSSAEPLAAGDLPQLTAASPKSWSELINELGVPGVLAWYLYYTTSVAGPRRDKEHRDQLAAIVAQFSADLAAERQSRATMQAELIQAIKHGGGPHG